MGLFPRVFGTEVSAGGPAKLGRVGRLKVVNTPTQLLKLGYASIDACPSGVEPSRQVRANGLVGPGEVDAGDLADLAHRES